MGERDDDLDARCMSAARSLLAAGGGVSAGDIGWAMKSIALTERKICANVATAELTLLTSEQFADSVNGYLSAAILGDPA